MAPSEKQIPAATAEDQEGIVARTLGEPIVVGTPAFSSPDPLTEKGRMLPLTEDVSAGAVAAENEATSEVVLYADMDKDVLEKLVAERELDVEGTGSNGNVLKDDLVKALNGDDAVGLKASDFKKLLEVASTQDELDAIGLQYEAGGRKYSTVEAAIEAKQTEINDAAKTPPQS